MISYHSLEALPFGDVVPLELVFGRMDTIVAEKLAGVEQVEEAPSDGIDDGGQDNGEQLVGYARYQWRLGDQCARRGGRWREDVGGIGCHGEAALAQV